MDFHGSKTVNIQLCGSAADSSMGVGALFKPQMLQLFIVIETHLYWTFLFVQTSIVFIRIRPGTLYLHDHFTTTVDLFFFFCGPFVYIFVAMFYIFAFASVKLTSQYN